MAAKELHIVDNDITIQSVNNSKELAGLLSKAAPLTYSVLFIRKGSVTIKAAEGPMLITTKKLILIGSDVPFTVSEERKPLVCYIISIAASFYNGELLKKTTYSQMTYLSNGIRFFTLDPLDNRVIALLFKGLEAAVRSPDAPSVFISYIINLLSEQVRANYVKKYAQEILFFSHKQLLAYRFIELITKHSKEHHTVEYYADILCITRGHLTKVLRETGNKTPKQCIADILVSQSKELLLSPGLSITTISEMLGFSCPAIFSTFIKKHLGITPSEYRESLIQHN